MSRNIGRTDCAICDEKVVLLEQPRPVRSDEVGPYKTYIEILTVANAECSMCKAKYLAWVECSGSWARKPGANKTHVDLSFRSSFNDEPGPDDLPDKETLHAMYQQNRRKRLGWALKDFQEKIEEMLTQLRDEMQTIMNSSESFWESYRR